MKIAHLLAAALLALPCLARAAGEGCQNTTGYLVLEKIRAGAVGAQMVGCINRTFDTLSVLPTTSTIAQTTTTVAALGVSTNTLSVSTAALNTAKVAKAGDTMTGNLVIDGSLSTLFSSYLFVHGASNNSAVATFRNDDNTGSPGVLVKTLSNNQSVYGLRIENSGGGIVHDFYPNGQADIGKSSTGGTTIYGAGGLAVTYGLSAATASVSGSMTVSSLTARGGGGISATYGIATATAAFGSPSTAHAISTFTTNGSLQLAVGASLSIDNGALTDGSVLTADLANLAVDTTKLAADAVDSSKLLTGAVTNPKIGALAVDTGKLASDAVDSTKVLTGAINTVKLAADAVDSTKVLTGAINTVKLAADAVDSTKIRNGSVNTSKMAADAITHTQLLYDSASLAQVTAGTAKISASGNVQISTGYKNNAGTTITAQDAVPFEVVGPSSATLYYSSIPNTLCGSAGGYLFSGANLTGPTGVSADGTSGGMALCSGGTIAMRVLGARIAGGNNTAGNFNLSGSINTRTAMPFSFNSDTGSGMGQSNNVQGSVLFTSSAAPIMAYQTSGTTTPTTGSLTILSGVVTPGNAFAQTNTTVTIQGNAFSVGGSSFAVAAGSASIGFQLVVGSTLSVMGSDGTYSLRVATGIHVVAGSIKFDSGSGGITWPDGSTSTSAATSGGTPANAVFSTSTPNGSSSSSSMGTCVSGSTITVTPTGGGLEIAYGGTISDTSGGGSVWCPLLNGTFAPGCSSTKGFVGNTASLSSNGLPVSGPWVSTGTYSGGPISVCMTIATNTGTAVVPGATSTGFTDIGLFSVKEIK